MFYANDGSPELLDVLTEDRRTKCGCGLKVSHHPNGHSIKSIKEDGDTYLVSAYTCPGCGLYFELHRTKIESLKSFSRAND